MPVLMMPRGKTNDGFVRPIWLGTAQAHPKKKMSHGFIKLRLWKRLSPSCLRCRPDSALFFQRKGETTFLRAMQLTIPARAEFVDCRPCHSISHSISDRYLRTLFDTTSSVTQAQGPYSQLMFAKQLLDTSSNILQGDGLCEWFYQHAPFQWCLSKRAAAAKSHPKSQTK